VCVKVLKWSISERIIHFYHGMNAGGSGGGVSPTFCCFPSRKRAIKQHELSYSLEIERFSLSLSRGEFRVKTVIFVSLEERKGQ
jgi:hypothetical protein